MVSALKKGFSLTEILITAAIVTLLLLVALWTLQSQLGKGRDARRKSDLSQLKVVAEDYYNDNNCYPPPEAFNCQLPAGDPGTGLQPYFEKVPCDPFTGEPYYIDLDPSSCPQWYRLYTTLEFTSDPGIEEVGCSSGCGPGGAYNWGVATENTSLVGGTGGDGDGDGGTPPPGGTNYYGCKSGTCTLLPGPVCSPNYLEPDCFGQCGTPSDPRNECI